CLMKGSQFNAIETILASARPGVAMLGSYICNGNGRVSFEANPGDGQDRSCDKQEFKPFQGLHLLFDGPSLLVLSTPVRYTAESPPRPDLSDVGPVGTRPPIPFRPGYACCTACPPVGSREPPPGSLPAAGNNPPRRPEPSSGGEQRSGPPLLQWPPPRR